MTGLNHFCRRTFSLLAGLGLTLASAVPALAADSAETLAGKWEGRLDAGGAQLPLVFHIDAGVNGVTGKLDSPAQGAFGLPLRSVTLDGDAVTLVLAAPPASFEGKLSADGKSIAGHWKQGGASLPLTMSRTDQPTGPKRPQTPQPPFPYAEEEVRYRNDVDGVDIAGTLTTPREGGPFPAVLLITGSGAQDRDETLFGHKPFLVIADDLTRRGIAVLRVDDRGVGGTDAGPAGATSLDFANDVEAGVAFLAGHPKVRKSAIGLIGHSEGGLIAPIVANRSSNVAFVVLLAGPGMTGEEILYVQSDLIMRANGATNAQVSANRKTQEGLFALARDESLSSEQIREKGRAILLADPNVPPGPQSEPHIKAQLDRVASPWMRFFLTYDPRPALETLRVPVLSLIGSRDLQVPAQQNLDAIRAALVKAGNTDHTLAEIPDLNHLFQTCTTGSPSEYSTIEETFSPSVLEQMGNWITERTRKMR